MRLSETISNDPLRILPYGMTGSGKTSLIGRMAQFEEFRPMYIADWDARVASLRATLAPEYWQYIETDVYRDGNIGGEAYTLMQAKIEKLASMNIKTFIIDSGTFMMKGIMNRVLALDGKPITMTPQLQHYNQLISIFEEIVARVCGKKMNFIMTCHEATLQDEVTQRIYKVVDLTGKKAPNRIPGYFNEFWHCEVRQTTAKGSEFVVRTRSDNTYAARTSFRTLTNEEPQTDIWQKIIKERANVLQQNIGATAAKVDSPPKAVA